MDLLKATSVREATKASVTEAENLVVSGVSVSKRASIRRTGSRAPPRLLVSGQLLGVCDHRQRHYATGKHRNLIRSTPASFFPGFLA
jgi:hypothetical protein